MSAPVRPVVRTPFDDDPPVQAASPAPSVRTPFDDDPPTPNPVAVLSATFNRARQGNPEAMAQGFALRAKTGLPPAVTARNLELVQSQVGDADIDFAAFLNEHPATVKWLEDEANATVARDDWKQLGKLERLIGRWNLGGIVERFGSELAQARSPGLVQVAPSMERSSAPMLERPGILQVEYEQAAVVEELGRIGLIPPARRDAALRARAAELEAYRGRFLPESESTLESFLRASARIAPSIVESVEGASVGTGVGATVGFALGGPAGAAFGAKAGGLIGGATTAFGMEAGNAALEFEKLTDENGQPIDPDLAYAAALTYGAGAAALEMAGLAFIARPFAAPFRSVARQGVSRAMRQATTRGALLAGARAWGGAVAGETGTEVLQQLAQLATEQGARSASNWLDDTSFDAIPLERVGREALTVAVETAMGMTLLGVPGASVTTIDAMGRVAAAVEAKERLVTMGEAVEASALRERSPEAWRAAIEADVAEHGPVTDLAVPVDRLQVLLQTAAVPLEEFLRVLPNRSAYDQALASGGDVVIPLADYIAKVAGTPLHEALVDDIRVRPGAMTAREAAEAQKTLEKDMAALRSEVEAAAKETPADESAQRVVQDLTERLASTGVYTASQVADMAKAAAAPYVVLAKRTGQDAFALYQSRNIRILGPERAEPLYDLTRAVQAAEQRGAAPEEVATLRSRLKRLSDERIAIRAVLEEADQSQDARDEAGRLRRDLRTVSTESLVLEYLSLRDQVLQAEGEVTGIEATIEAARSDAGNVATDEEFVGVVEAAGFGALLGDAETWAGKRLAFERAMRASRAVVTRYARSVPRLAAELEARGVTNPDEYADEHDLLGDASFDVEGSDFAAGLTQSSVELMDRIGEASEALPEDRIVRLRREREAADRAGRDARVAADLRMFGTPVRVLAERARMAGEGLVRLERTLESPVVLEQAAFHGTAHNVDRFTTAKIGTGEGAQVYGWGLYFAEREGVAAEYQRALAGRNRDNRAIAKSLAPEGWDYGAVSELALLAGDEQVWPDAQDAARNLVSRVASLRQGDARSLTEIAKGIAPLIQRVREEIGKQSGNLYKVEIPDAAVAKFLDWDKPVSPEVLAAIERTVSNDFLERAEEALNEDRAQWTGGEAYRVLVQYAREGELVGDDVGIERGDEAASKYLLRAGIPGIRYLDAGSRGAQDGTRNLVVFDESLITITHKNGEPVTAAERTEFLEQSRGARPNAFILPGKAEQVIALMETADLSSFLHEMGHEYLNLLEFVASQEDAPQSVKDDLAIALEQIGAESVATASREQLEVFARGFEAYLQEGQAPSRALLRAFTRFRIWLTRIYDAARRALAPISPELRGVFDRLMATEEELAAAQAESGSGPMFTSAEQAGMTDAEYASYLRTVELRDAQAGAHLAKTLLAERNKERTAAWQEREEEVRDIIAERVDAEPVERAVTYFRTGKLPDGTKHERPAKLHKALLVPLYGDGITKTLPKGTFSRTEGGDADSFALMFGFPDGDSLISALQRYEPRAKRIERLVGEEMRRLFPDLLGNTPAPAAAAQHSLHLAENDLLVIEEMKRLGATTGMRPPNVRAVKALAAEIVGGTAVRDLQPQRFLNAESKANRLAEEALKKGDRTRAAFHKRQQLLNRILYREAVAALERAEVVERFMQRMGKTPAQQRLGKAGAHYLDTMNDLLDQYEFRRVSARELRRRSSLLAFVQRVQEEEGLTLEVPPAVLAKAERTNYRALTVDALQGVYDAAQQVWHVATTKDKLLRAQKARELADIEAEIVGSIETHHDLTPATQDTRERFAARVTRFLENADAWHLKPEWIFRELDGDTDAGPVWTHLFKPIADAENAEHVMLEGVRAQLEALFAMIPAERRGGYLERVVEVPGLTVKLTHGAALSLALNWGNAGNRDAILASTIHGRPQWTVEQVHAVLATLTRDEWAFVKATWEYINTFWPDIAALQTRLTGLAPDKVEADPFTVRTADGFDLELPGGYYPLQYDGSYSWAQFKADVKGETQDIGATSYTRAATKHGHTETRVGSGGKPVKLDLSVLTNHVRNVVHDLTHREAILDVNRLLERPGVRSAIEQAVGIPMYRALRPWLVRVANDRLPPASPVEELLGRARVGATIVNMGLKVTTAVVQPLGILQTVDLVGAKYTRRGLSAFFANPRKAWRYVKESSTAMRNRQASFDRDVRDITKRKGKLSGIERAWFYFTGLADMAVAVPSWIGAYQKSMETLAPGDHEAAVAFADSAVRLSQSGGAAKDLARIQGGPESMRLFTMFYSYFSALYGLGRRRVAGLKQGRIGVPEFAGSVLLLWFLPSVLSELIAGRGPEDDEDAAAWAAWQVARYPLGAMVGVRDLASALGPDGFSYELSPVTSAGRSLADALQAVGGVVLEMMEDGEPDITRREVKAVVEAVGYWGHLPSRQMWITGTYLYDWMMGYEQPETPLEATRNLAFPRPR